MKPTDLNDLIRKTSEMFGRTKKEIRITRRERRVPGSSTPTADRSNRCC